MHHFISHLIYLRSRSAAPKIFHLPEPPFMLLKSIGITYGVMQRKIGLLVVLLFLSGIGVSACGTESKSDESDTERTDFTIPWPDGGEVVTEDWDDNTGRITLRYESDSYQTVVKFYDDYTSGNGWNRSEIGQGEVPTINYMNLAAGLNISVDPPGDQIAGSFIVTLTIS